MKIIILANIILLSAVTCIFSFSHNVFNHITDINHHFSQYYFVVCSFFQFGPVWNFDVWQSVNFHLTLLPNDKILDKRKLKAFAYDKCFSNDDFMMVFTTKLVIICLIVQVVKFSAGSQCVSNLSPNLENQSNTNLEVSHDSGLLQTENLRC